MLSEPSIEKLRKELIALLEQYDDKVKVKLNTSPELLNQLIFKQANPIYNPFFKEIIIPFELVKKLDLSDASFDCVNISGIDFTGSKGIVINPQKVHNKALVGTKLTDTIIDGPLDGVCIVGADFTGSKGTVINPQKLCSKDLEGTKLTDTIIEGSFENVDISGADFTGSKGAFINPQKVYKKNLEKTNLTDTQIIGPFNGCNICNAVYNGKLVSELIIEESKEDREYYRNLSLIKKSFK